MIQPTITSFPTISDWQETNQIYLDTAATSLTPQVVIDKIIEYYCKNPISNHSGYNLAIQLTEKIEHIRRQGTELMHATNYNHIFTASATDGFNKLAMMYGSILQPEDTILISLYEHHANLLPWLELSRKIGCQIQYYKPNAKGELTINDLERLINKYRPRLLAITRCSNINGYIPDMITISKVCQDYSTDLIIDGTQYTAWSQEHIDNIQPTAYITSWHKAYGPKGVGSIFLHKESVLNNSLAHTGGGIVTSVTIDKVTYLESPYRFEVGTANFASILALSATFELLSQIYTLRPQLGGLSQLLYNRLLELSWIKLVPNTNTIRGVFSFRMDNCHSLDVAEYLNTRGVMIRNGQMCAQPILNQLEFENVLRVSLGIYNDAGDVDNLVESLTRAYQILKNNS